MDFKGLRCGDCKEAYEAGELADAEGKMVYDGGCDASVFRCPECPYELYGEIDEISHLAQTIWNLVCEPLVPDQPPPLQFFFDLMGVRVGSPESREIYGRMLQLSRIIKEHHELTNGDAPESAAQEDEG